MFIVFLLCAQYKSKLGDIMVIKSQGLSSSRNDSPVDEIDIKSSVLAVTMDPGVP